MGQGAHRNVGGTAGAEGGKLSGESTRKRAIALVDVSELEGQLIGLSAGARQAGGLRGQAMDGKQVRGCGTHGRLMHLLSVARHGDGAVLAQVEVGTKENEIVVVPELLEGLELGGTVTTMDALLTQRKLAGQILGQGGHYLMVVKDN